MRGGDGHKTDHSLGVFKKNIPYRNGNNFVCEHEFVYFPDTNSSINRFIFI